MPKKLISDPRFCSGCMACVVNCSQFHEGHAAPVSARIQVDHDPFTGEYVARYCHQCEEKVCAHQCSSGAIVEDAEGCLKINYELCTGCRTCIAACPHGGIFFDPLTSKIIKCDTCNGNPQCATACYTGALLWIEPERAHLFEEKKLTSKYFFKKRTGS